MAGVGDFVEGDNDAPKPGVAPRFRDAKMLDGVVAQLKEIERRTGIERTLAIGELVLTQFFGGNPAAWRDRRRNKNNSIRRLAERNDCPFCRSALNEAVGVYVAVLALPCVRTYGHVCASHVAAVLGLPVAERDPMLALAEREHWSVRELRQRVVDHRRSGGERRGRPPVGSEARTVSALHAVVAKLGRMVSALDEVGLLSVESQALLRTTSSQLSAIGVHLIDLIGPDVTRSRVSELDLRQRSA
jgi:hypothetical protein